ncbi:MAG TPA: 50S ribosomal protein L22 [Acidobacteriaceae bacterium]|nr:50S ribosomal protein L22 [Acidobacteriaceae bacterium]
MANKTTTPEFRAEARFQRSSPQKAKLVLDLIKGKRVEAALNIVAFTHKKMAPVIEGVLRSAVQNALYLSDERGLDIDADNLIVKTAVANEGPRLKRLRPAPMGRAFRYQRRLTHIIITVAEKKAAETGVTEEVTTGAKAGQPARKAVAKKAAAKKSAPKKAVAA